MNTTQVKASSLPKSTLPMCQLSALCADFVGGFCRRGENCQKSHEICAIAEAKPTREAPMLDSAPNFLSLDPRLHPSNGRAFDDDGPGNLSGAGARHRNDHVDICDITILPTTDEILSKRPPFMPKKDHHTHHLLGGPARHIDINFRQLRYEHTESLIDICYHASQRLVKLQSTSQVPNYEYSAETPQGRRYSMFRDVEFVELSFEEHRGIVARMSFSCPAALRGRNLRGSGHLESGMLAALIGIDEHGTSLSTTFLEIALCQSTEAMKLRTGNELRASALFSFADRQDTEAVRRVVYNMQGLLSERFVLVEFPGVLLAGFSFCLKQLQNLSQIAEDIAFSSLVAPSSRSCSPTLSQPDYTTADDFAFKCDILQKRNGSERSSPLSLNPKVLALDDRHQKEFIKLLGKRTTLDGGQATALCENLCRGMAFTQGPPGTGKTFLGVALTKVILASRKPSDPKPILAVCMTNHALDSFLGDLRNAGVTKLARLGRGSKEEWITQYQISELSRQMKLTQFERSNLNYTRLQVEGLTREGVGWCEALNQDSTSWPAIRGHLKINYRTAYDSFVNLECINESILSDIRLARKAGGFAFEFWCQGGDIKDISQLLDCFSTILGSNESVTGSDADDERARDRVLAGITRNVKQALGTRLENDVWCLPLQLRQHMLKKWKEEVNPWIIVDQTVEIHRRHYLAGLKKKEANQGINARCLAQQEVIGLTTTACAMNWSLLNQLGLQTVICEEAGEVTEAQTLCTLFPSVEHAIFIGDPLQLRPQVNEQSLSLETTAGQEYRLDESLFERMMLPSAPGVLPLATSRLNLQRRMHPEIADLMRVTLYPFLQDHESTHLHPPVAGMVERLWWLDHQRPEDRSDSYSATSKSFSNSFEVEMAVELVQYLMNTNEYDFNDIAILTPYNGQLAAFAQRLKGTCSVWLSDKDRGNLIDEGLLTDETGKFGNKADVAMSSMLRLATIDNYQGEEAKVIILSTVRSNAEARIGFLKTSNRINVACSRARNGFFIIGNASLMKGVKMWDKIVNHLTKKSKIGNSFQACCSRHREQTYVIKDPRDFDQIPTCKVSCESQLSCGHSCKDVCHAESLHSRKACLEPCNKHHESCGHQCSKICSERCGECSFQLPSVKLPCGHAQKMACIDLQAKKKVVCDFTVASVVLDCGHSHNQLCSSKDEPIICQLKCESPLDCGHRCPGRCSDCQATSSHATCVRACEKEHECGHKCAAPCHASSCPPCQLTCEKSCEHGSCSRPCNQICDPCVKPCSWTCEHLGPCPTMCSLPCGRVPCNEPCDQILLCGHLCPSLCGERCARKCPQCQTGSMPEKVQIYLKCGHHFDLAIIDAHVGLSNVYDIDSMDIIKRPLLRFSTIKDLDNRACCCPECGESCDDVRRYAIFKQLRALPDTIDRLYAKMGRKMELFMDWIIRTREDLQNSFEDFCKKLRPGPLNGKTNERWVRDRGNAMMEVQRKIVNFRDDVVVRFETDLARLVDFLGNSKILARLTLPFKIRHDSLYYRCRLVTLEESVRMCGLSVTLGQTSHHMATLFQGLREITTDQALQNTEQIESTIADCEARNLKRLEVELRLLQVSFHIVLMRLGDTSNVDIKACLDQVQTLCTQYPDTAGVFAPIYRSLKLSYEGQPPTKELYSRDGREFWRQWGKYEVGHLTYCILGHPYSNKTFNACPECGRKVDKRPKTETIDYGKFLHENAFLAQMLRMKVNA